jgi:hypothetical protein
VKYFDKLKEYLKKQLTKEQLLKNLASLAKSIGESMNKKGGQ